MNIRNILITLCLLAVFPLTVSAKVLTVLPGKSIQEKIDEAEDNDFELIFPAENESKYLIQISSDLNRWLSLRVINGEGKVSREKFSILDGYGFFRVLEE